MFVLTRYIYRGCLIDLKEMCSMHFITNFEISLVNYLNVFGFLLLVSEKNEGYTFLICYFLQLFEYFWWFVQVSAIFERLFSCYFVVPISLTGRFRKINTHTHTHTPHCFSLKNNGQSFFLNHLFLQFSFRINYGFYFCEKSLPEEIRGILLCKYKFCKNIYLPKNIFRKNLFL